MMIGATHQPTSTKSVTIVARAGVRDFRPIQSDAQLNIGR